jgi:CheY-like chemotaxis protein
MMPGMGGEQLIDRARAIKSREALRFITMSGHAEATDTAQGEATNGPADAHLTKPIQVETLIQLVGTVLEDLVD